MLCICIVTIPSTRTAWTGTDMYERCTLHRVIPGTYEGNRRGIRTTVFGEKRQPISLLHTCIARRLT